KRQFHPRAGVQADAGRPDLRLECALLQHGGGGTAAVCLIVIRFTGVSPNHSTTDAQAWHVYTPAARRVALEPSVGLLAQERGNIRDVESRGRVLRGRRATAPTHRARLV